MNSEVLTPEGSTTADLGAPKRTGAWATLDFVEDSPTRPSAGQAFMTNATL